MSYKKINIEYLHPLSVVQILLEIIRINVHHACAGWDHSGALMRGTSQFIKQYTKHNSVCVCVCSCIHIYAYNCVHAQ